MDLLTSQDAPILVKIGENTYTFPVWTTKELLPVLAKLRQQRLDILRKHMKEQGVTKDVMAYTLAQEEIKPLDVYDAHIHFMSAEGVDECLTFSLRKAGSSAEDAEKVAGKLRYEDKKNLAMKVAAIYEITTHLKPTPARSKTEGIGFGDPADVIEQPKVFGDKEVPANP